MVHEDYYLGQYPLKKCGNASLLFWRDQSKQCQEKKLEIGDEIQFAGHIVSHRGIKPDPAKFQAIKDFPTQRNIKELRSYMGLKQGWLASAC